MGSEMCIRDRVLTRPLGSFKEAQPITDEELIETIHALAVRTMNALPGTTGFVGIDLVIPAHDELVVVEVNPRLTSSYGMLRGVAGFNIGHAMMQL